MTGYILLPDINILLPDIFCEDTFCVDMYIKWPDTFCGRVHFVRIHFVSAPYGKSLPCLLLSPCMKGSVTTKRSTVVNPPRSVHTIARHFG